MGGSPFRVNPLVSSMDSTTQVRRRGLASRTPATLTTVVTISPPDRQSGRLDNPVSMRGPPWRMSPNSSAFLTLWLNRRVGIGARHGGLRCDAEEFVLPQATIVPSLGNAVIPAGRGRGQSINPREWDSSAREDRQVLPSPAGRRCRAAADEGSLSGRGWKTLTRPAARPHSPSGRGSDVAILLTARLDIRQKPRTLPNLKGSRPWARRRAERRRADARSRFVTPLNPG
jgi:hypothetical protein